MNNNTLAQTTTLQATITSDLYNRFIAYADVKEKSLQTYKRALKQFALWLSDNNIVSPTREDILAYRSYLSTDHKPTTVQAYIVAVRLFFQWLEISGIYPDVTKHVKGAKISKDHKKDYLTPAQVKEVLSSIDRTTLQGVRDYALICLMVTCGLRDIEVYRANTEDIRTVGEHTVLFIQGKGRDEKTDFVKLPVEVYRAIREYLNQRGTTAPDHDGTPLFTSMSNNSSRGSRMSTRSISGAVKVHFIEAGYNSSRLTAHSLRHTAVTISLLSGNSLQEVQEFARHTNIATTQIYAHNLDRLNNKCESSIATAIF